MKHQRFAVELRTAIKGNRLSGHASVFGQMADVGPHYERMKDTSFHAVLKDPETDVRALWNHNPDFLLGRQSSGTLKLGVDSEGLEFDLDLPNTTVGNDLRELAARGDLSGASFAFIPGEDEWGTAPDGRKIRTHTSVQQLLDVSPVTFPAYSEATTVLRSMKFEPVRNGRSALIRARARLLLERSRK